VVLLADSSSCSEIGRLSDDTLLGDDPKLELFENSH